MAKDAAEVGSTANQYQILAKLAVGGMAEIFLARSASIGGVERYCVLKRVLRDRASDAQFVRMFLDEARLAAQLQHPNIASVYDIGMLGDSYFFTMEYVHGETIRSLLQRAQGLRRPLPLACVLTIIAGAASGLHHAHERNANDGRPLGIVHRDVSPSNLMVSFEGNTKLVDFGVAKAADRAVETRSGTVKGKISYLSPEQCRGARVDRRSDIFSLGIVMWEMLTGARLYRRTSDFENMTAIVNEPMSAPSALRTDLPRAVDDIVAKLLAKDPAARYQTADEVVEAIEHASMRAGTILSTSAVSRLVRELFGTRAEPWIELDLAARQHEAATLMSRPVPHDLGLAEIDPVEAELGSVIDLSMASIAVETQSLPDVAGVAAAPVRPTPVPGFAAAAPSAPHPVPVSGPASGPIPVLDPIAIAAAHATTIRITPAAGSRLTAPSDAGSHKVPTSSPFAPTAKIGGSTLLHVGAPAARTTESTPVFSPASRPSGPIVAVPRVGSSAPLPVRPELGTSSDMIVLRAGAERPVAGRSRRDSVAPPTGRRVAWPLVAVIAGATVTGIVLVWLWMRPPSARPPSPVAEPGAAAAVQDAAASDPGAPASEPGSPPTAAPPSPAEPAVPAAAASPASGAPATAHAAAPDAAEIDFADDRGAGSARTAPDAARAQVAVARGPIDAGVRHAPADAIGASDDEIWQPRTAPAHTGTPPAPPAHPGTPPAPPAHPGTSPAPPAHPDPALPSTPSPLSPQAHPSSPSTPAAHANPQPRLPTLADLTQRFNNNDYAEIVKQCSAAPGRGDIARVCLLAACVQNNLAQAKLWMALNDPTKHAQLVAYCESHGTHIQ